MLNVNNGVCCGDVTLCVTPLFVMDIAKLPSSRWVTPTLAYPYIEKPLFFRILKNERNSSPDRNLWKMTSLHYVSAVSIGSQSYKYLRSQKKYSNCTRDPLLWSVIDNDARYLDSWRRLNPGWSFDYVFGDPVWVKINRAEWIHNVLLPDVGYEVQRHKKKESGRVMLIDKEARYSCIISLVTLQAFIPFKYARGKGYHHDKQPWWCIATALGMRTIEGYGKNPNVA